MNNAANDLPPLTSAEFDALMIRILPVTVHQLNAGVARPLVAMALAQHLWIENVPLSADTEMFRAHMRHLQRTGWFGFTDFLAEV